MVVLYLMSILNVASQNGYKKDSLQIKVYTIIEYINNEAKSIEVKRVFCDYCSDIQVEAISEEAKKRSYAARNAKENRLENGIRKLSLYIRISKKDFAAIKEEEH
jgi:hypothetical protein